MEVNENKALFMEDSIELGKRIAVMLKGLSRHTAVAALTMAKVLVDEAANDLFISSLESRREPRQISQPALASR